MGQQADGFDRLMRRLNSFTNFVDQNVRVTESYISQFPDLVAEIKKLRALDRGIPMTDAPDSVLDDPADHQLLVRTWRSVARSTHPDRGGDPRIFAFANSVYRAQDLSTLNAIYQSLHNPDFSLAQFMDSKLKALTEIERSKTRFLVAKLHSQKRVDEARATVERALKRLIFELQTRNCLRVLTNVNK